MRVKQDPLCSCIRLNTRAMGEVFFLAYRHMPHQSDPSLIWPSNSSADLTGGLARASRANLALLLPVL